MRCVLAAYVAAGIANTAAASVPSLLTSNYIRRNWGAEQGFPGGSVHAIAETADGYLWIASDKGLFRFDGFNFQVFDEVNSGPVPHGAVQKLAVDSAGNLWIQEQNMTLFRYPGDRFQNAAQDLVTVDRSVTAMCRGKDGEILFLSPSRGILKYSAGRVQTLFITSGMPNFLVISMAQTADGNIWLGTRDAGLFSLDQNRKLTVVQEFHDRKINTLLSTGAHDLWVGTDTGAARWNGASLRTTGIPDVLEHTQILAILKDHRSNIWVSTSGGLLRIDARGVAVWEEHREAFDGAVNALFEDREGNIWVGSDGGLTRFEESTFSSYPVAVGSRAESSGPLYVDDEDRTWSAAPQGGLMWRRDGQAGTVTPSGLDKDVVVSIAGRKGELWIGRRRGGLTHLRYRGKSFYSETYTHAQGLAQDSVYAIHESPDGTVWAGTLTGGVSRLKDGRFSTYTEANGLASNTVNTIAEGPDGTMWFGTSRGVSEFSSGRWRRYTGRDGLPPGGVNCLFLDSTGTLWIGTPRGLVFKRLGRLQNCRDARGALEEEILGIAEDRSGWLWIATANHILRVNCQKLLDGAVGPSDLREYGITDGLLGSQGVKRNRSVVSDSAGRIWISTNRGISVVDPAGLAGDLPPVIAHMQAISADGRPLRPGNAVQVPAGRKRIIFGYVGLSLSFPERVRYRYKLEGFDRDWSEPTTAREAVYTNLAPGPYGFHVEASNTYDIWDSRAATVRIQVEAAFWQTWWFRFVCGLAVVLAATAVYRLRLNQISGRLRLRFEERLSERTRIAQELHDTMLQVFLSASMQMHVAWGRLAADSPAMPPLSRAMELIQQANEEGRTALHGLRSRQHDHVSLEQAFSCLPAELGESEGISFRVIVVGPQRLLQPVLRDDAYGIGREGLVNAFRHSQGTHIEVELDYAEEQFRLTVRDDGSGIDPHVLESGRDGHWGLTGMRERARRIGAKLTFWSSAAGGTEVVLSVPAHIAYETQPAHSSWRWVRALFSHNLGNRD